MMQNSYSTHIISHDIINQFNNILKLMTFDNIQLNFDMIQTDLIL